MLRAWLIRHGESESNAGIPSAGPGTSPLTERGTEQAARVAALMPERPALIVMSPYLRARQTAEPTVARFPDVPREEWPVQEFTYLGMFHDRLTTIDERRANVVQYWNRADPHLRLDGAESFVDLLGRVDDLLARLTTQTAGPVAVFTHGMFIRAVVWTLLTGPNTDMRAFHRFSAGLTVPNCTVAELRIATGAAPRVVAGAVW